jgi:peptidoglycan/xylan/chitin deacetylase (PgdA/CDA1 family)
MTALICLTYDDALAVHREMVAPSLAARGLHATFYVPAAQADLHNHVPGWRAAARAGHELGNHSCFHPCRGPQPWLAPAYDLQTYDRRRLIDELELANRLLHLVDARGLRSYGATCGDLTCGPGLGEPFADDLRSLFPVIRSGQTKRPLSGPLPYVAPSLPGDGRRAAEIIAVAEQMRDQPDAWLLICMHGVGAVTHGLFIDDAEHRLLIDWIAEQRAWLEAVTVMEAARRHPPLK